MRISLCLFLHVALIEYNNVCGKTLQQSIESEMSGNLEKLLVAVGKFIHSFKVPTAAVFSVDKLNHFKSL